MLELRPTCEHCNKALPPNSTEAMICSFECTFCRECVATILHDVCRNCGGGFTARPIRPCRNLRGDNYLGVHPASTMVKHGPVDVAAHDRFSESIRNVPPDQR